MFFKKKVYYTSLIAASVLARRVHTLEKTKKDFSSIIYFGLQQKK